MVWNDLLGDWFYVIKYSNNSSLKWDWDATGAKWTRKHYGLVYYHGEKSIVNETLQANWWLSSIESYCLHACFLQSGLVFIRINPSGRIKRLTTS